MVGRAGCRGHNYLHWDGKLGQGYWGWKALSARRVSRHSAYTWRVAWLSAAAWCSASSSSTSKPLWNSVIILTRAVPCVYVPPMSQLECRVLLAP